MTRSFATDPPGIRAARRIKAPRGRRDMEEAARRRLLRLQRKLGLGAEPQAQVEPGQRVEIVEVPPRRGYLHPLKPADIKRALDFFGPLAVYGLRSVELRPLVGPTANGVAIARLHVPGRVVLFEQPNPPWNLRALSDLSVNRLRRAGASVESSDAYVRVDWTPQALREFVLFEGLMHEIGHHLVQQHTGKRSGRVMRTADHEKRAVAFAEACRRAWYKAGRRP
jgi:hypothetical protein